MSDLGDLIARTELGERPATIPVGVYAAALAEINRLRGGLPGPRPDGFLLPGGESTSAALRRAEQERDAARGECDAAWKAAARLRGRLEDGLAVLEDVEGEARAEIERLTAELEGARDSLDARTRALVRARAEIGSLIAMTTSRHGTTLCPRCGVALAAEVEQESTP